MSLSERGQAAIRPPSAYQQSLTHLPPTTIDLATAENALSRPSITALLHQIPPIPPTELTYTSMHGSPETITAVSTFLSAHLHVAIPPETLTLTSGVSASLDALAHALAEHGESAITPSPCYRGFRFLLTARSGVRLVTAPTDATFPPALSVDALDAAWRRAGGVESDVRFLLLTNPDNPTGVVHPPQLIIELVQWAREQELHIVLDECYALSTHHRHAFHSVLSLIGPANDVHVVWGVSKDFSLPGIRLGAIITHNPQLQQALRTNLAYFATASRLAQYAITNLLPALPGVLSENRQRLRRAYDACRTRLEGMGVRVVQADAGFFVWADFGQWVRDKDAEQRLWTRFCERGVLVLPGSEASASTPGCFRVCYAGVEGAVLENGLRRIETVLRDVEQEREGD